MNPANRVRIKVCGITRLADAESLDALGIDFLGFNFHPGSKRFIDPKAASSIIRGLKAEPVGVFVDLAPDRIAEIADQTGIRWAQLHGREGWDVLNEINLPVIKAIPHSQLNDFGGLKERWNEGPHSPRFFLVDTLAGSEFGGSGKTFDWSLLREQALPRPFFLAGGLGPENVAEAVAQTRPYAVDLNSQVETSPGVKDVVKVKECLRQLRDMAV